MVLIFGYMEQHHVHNTITLEGWSVETSKAELSWNRKVAHLIFIITSAVPPFRSLKTIKKRPHKISITHGGGQKGVYFIGNSLIEGCWIGHISIRKGQQNSTFEPIKGNLIGLEFRELLDYYLQNAIRWSGVLFLQKWCCCSHNMTLRQLSVVNFDNERLNQGMIQQHLGNWDANLYLMDRAELIKNGN